MRIAERHALAEAAGKMPSAAPRFALDRMRDADSAISERRGSVAMKDALRIDTSSALATIALKLFAWVVVLSLGMWLALALVSLRFDI